MKPALAEPRATPDGRGSIFLNEGRSADWHMQSMSIPLPRPIRVDAGWQVRVRFQYETDGSIESLVASLSAELLTDR